MIISDDLYNEFHIWTKQFINDNCIVRDVCLPGKIPDTWYSWMFYLKRGLFHKQFMSAIATMFLYKAEREISKDLDFQITGLETAATPMVACIPIILETYFGKDINGFSIRKEPKEYGLKNIIEGCCNDKPVLMMDDLCNSSISMRKCYDILTAYNLNVLPYAFVIVNKSNKDVHTEERMNSDMYLPNNIKVISLYTLDDFGLTNPSH